MSKKMKLLIDQGGKRKTLETDSPEIYIGKAGENEIVLLDDRSSERHCRIFRVDSGYHLSDLQTSIGTRLNGMQVQEAVLRPGDRIEIGETTIVYEPAPASPPKKSSFFLESVEGHLEGKRFDIDAEPLTFGRHKKNRVVLTDPGVSNYHAILTFDSQGVSITDLRSTNGTRVNGHKVERKTLSPGDKVSFMTAVFVLRGGDQTGTPSPAEAAPVKAAGQAAPPRGEGPGKAGPAMPGRVSTKTTVPATPEGDEPPGDEVIEFDYDLLMEETSRSSIAQTAGVVVIFLLIIAFGSLVLRGIVTQPPADPGPSRNLVDNWSFEQEGSWVFVEPATGGPDPAEPKFGKLSLRIDPALAGGEEAACRSIGARPVRRDRALQAKAWFRMDGPGIAGLRLRWLSDVDPDYYEESLAPLVIGPTDWENVAATFLPPDGATSVQVECFGRGSATLWADRVQLIEWEEAQSHAQISADTAGIKMRLDEKGVGDLFREGAHFVRGLELFLGEGQFGGMRACSPGRVDRSSGISLEADLYHEEMGHWDGVSVKAEDSPEGIGIVYSAPQEKARLGLRFFVSVRTVGGAGPVLGSEDADPETLPWEFTDRSATEIILGTGKRILSLGFSSPLRVSASLEGDLARFTLEGDPARMAQGGKSVLRIQASPISPLLEERTRGALGRARQLLDEGNWSEAYLVLVRVEKQESTPPEMVLQARGLRERIEIETARIKMEVNRLLDDYESLSAPNLIQAAQDKMVRLAGLWPGGEEVETLERLEADAAALQGAAKAREYEGEAARLYLQGRAHMDAGRYQLALLVYRAIKAEYPDSRVISKVDIDLEQIGKSGDR